MESVSCASFMYSPYIVSVSSALCNSIDFFSAFLNNKRQYQTAVFAGICAKGPSSFAIRQKHCCRNNVHSCFSLCPLKAYSLVGTAHFYHRDCKAVSKFFLHRIPEIFSEQGQTVEHLFGRCGCWFVRGKVLNDALLLCSLIRLLG